MKNALTTFSINCSLVHATERDHFNLEDVSGNALLASSGCYLVRSADSIAMANLRVAMRTLGFKPKHMLAISASLLPYYYSVTFNSRMAMLTTYQLTYPIQVLDQAARLFGVSPEDLDQIFTNKTPYVRKELFTVLLNAEQDGRDQYARDLYALLLSRLQTTV